MKTLKNIAFLLLASFYLTSASAFTVNAVIGAIPSSGTKALVADDGQSREIPPKLTMQRRHMPLAKDIPCPSVHIGALAFPSVDDEQQIVARTPFVHYSNGNYYSSFCDRAPPVA